MNEKLTAYVLNELPPDERAELEAQMKTDPALRDQAEEMKVFCDMLSAEVAGDESPALTLQQRVSVMRAFSHEAAEKKIARPFWRHPALLVPAAIAACVAFAMVWDGRQHAAKQRAGVVLLTEPLREKQLSEEVLVSQAKLERKAPAATAPKPATTAPIALLSGPVPRPRPEQLPWVPFPTLKESLAVGDRTHLMKAGDSTLTLGESLDTTPSLLASVDTPMYASVNAEADRGASAKGFASKANKTTFGPLVATTKGGSKSVTVASTTKLSVGKTVTGLGIPEGTRVVAILTDKEVALSKEALSSGKSSLTFADGADERGAAGNAANNLVFNGGALRFDGTSKDNGRFGAGRTAAHTIQPDPSAWTSRMHVMDGTVAVDAFAGNSIQFSNTDELSYNIALGGTAAPALRYTGAGVTTDRGFSAGQSVSGTGDTTIAAINGAGGLIKTGDGTLTLGGAQTYSGTTVVNEGVMRKADVAGDDAKKLSAGSAGGLGGFSGSAAGSNNIVVDLAPHAAPSAAPYVTRSTVSPSKNTYTEQRTSGVTLTPDVVSGGRPASDSGTVLQIQSRSRALTLEGSSSLDSSGTGALALGSAGNMNYNKGAPATPAPAATSPASVAFRKESGTINSVSFGNAGGAGANPDPAAPPGATMDLNGTAQTVSAGKLQSTNAPAAPSSASSFGGVVTVNQGTVTRNSLTKTGAGTWELSGANTLTGGITISAPGTLRVGDKRQTAQAAIRGDVTGVASPPVDAMGIPAVTTTSGQRAEVTVNRPAGASSGDIDGLFGADVQINKNSGLSSAGAAGGAFGRPLTVINGGVLSVADPLAVANPTAGNELGGAGTVYAGQISDQNKAGADPAMSVPSESSVTVNAGTLAIKGNIGGDVSLGNQSSGAMRNLSESNTWSGAINGATTPTYASVTVKPQSEVTAVAAGASLELQGGITVGGELLTLTSGGIISGAPAPTNGIIGGWATTSGNWAVVDKEFANAPVAGPTATFGTTVAGTGAVVGFGKNVDIERRITLEKGANFLQGGGILVAPEMGTGTVKDLAAMDAFGGGVRAEYSFTESAPAAPLALADSRLSGDVTLGGGTLTIATGTTTTVEIANNFRMEPLAVVIQPLVDNPTVTIVPPRTEQEQQLLLERRKLAEQQDRYRRHLEELERRNMEIARRRDPSNETYNRIYENPFLFVAQQPLSTFSIDVDTASYANVRRFLNDGQRPPPDAVRLEELINYFPYSYEGPGDGRPFGVMVNVAEAPWQPMHRLVRVALKGREVKEERGTANFVFLVDVSGSMDEPDKLPLVQRSLEMLTRQLGANDRVALVVYAGNSGLVLPSTVGTEKETILNAIGRLQAGGSTNGAGGIRLAYEQAAKHFVKGGVNRVILCTDGDFNVGISTPRELEKLIAEKAKSRIFLSVLGFGTGNLKDHTMETLADKGNGNYAYIDSLSEARKVLVEQMNGTLVTIAKDVKIQVEFNPKQVAAYRLLGYENRMLAKEDFNNDKKDAGEIGAGHTVTALYEVVPASVKFPDGTPLVDDLKYAATPQKPAEPAALAAEAPAPATQEMMTVKLRYKQPEGDKSDLLEVPVTDKEQKLADGPRDFQFAASVAGFGMLLRGSQHASDLTWDMVREMALRGKGEDALGYRGEFLQLIDKARGLTEGRR